MSESTAPRRSVILEVCVRAEIHTLLLVSLYFLFAGHNQPGGGFAGGLVASCALALRHVAGDRDPAAAPVVPAPVVLGGGVLLAVLAGIVPLIAGGQFLESSFVEVDVALLGTVKAGSVLVFDTGVYLVVLGMSLFLLEQFGGTDGSDPAADSTELVDGRGGPAS